MFATSIIIQSGIKGLKNITEASGICAIDIKGSSRAHLAVIQAKMS